MGALCWNLIGTVVTHVDEQNILQEEERTGEEEKEESVISWYVIHKLLGADDILQSLGEKSGYQLLWNPVMILSSWIWTEKIVVEWQSLLFQKGFWWILKGDNLLQVRFFKALIALILNDILKHEVPLLVSKASCSAWILSWYCFCTQFGVVDFLMVGLKCLIKNTRELSYQILMILRLF